MSWRAGGGGGAIAGGGGAGGVIYAKSLELAEGNYFVGVGAGGTSSGANYSGTNGGDSSFTNASGTVYVVTKGGGGGGSCNRPLNSWTGGKAGGSSGGMTIGYSPNGTAGQGNAGGNAYTISGSGNTTVTTGGGGGGAGSAGGNGTVEKGGDGGDGLPCAITGEMLHYGAGGGGGLCYATAATGGAGGLGGGGAGAVANNTSGSDGTFYGAGGGGGAKYASTGGGKGYRGVVIVAYTDYSSLGEDPLLEVGLPENVTETSFDLPVYIPYAGSGDTVSLSASWGYSSNDFTVGSANLATAFIGDDTFTIAGLNPNRTYYVKIAADNGNGGSTNAVMSFTTAAGLASEATVKSNTQALYTFQYTLTALGAGTTTLSLYTATTIAGLDTAEPVDSWTVDAVGKNLTRATLLNPQTLGYVFGTTYYYRLECENVDGSLTNSCFTDTGSFVLSDNATYTWKVGDGYWNDTNSWTCSVADSCANGYSLGYPVYGATAKFAENMCATVRVSRAERCMKLDLNFKNMYLAILGTGDTAKVVPDSAWTSQTTYGTGATYVFDHVTTWAPLWSTLTVAANVRVIAQNGAVHTISRYGSAWEYVTMSDYSGSSFEAYSGGKIESGSMRAARGNKLVADGGTLKVNSDMFLAYVSGQTAGKIIVGADLSRVEVPNQFTAAYAPAEIEFRIPREGYSSVPVSGNNSYTFAASGNTITLGASKALSELRYNPKNMDVRLVYWQKGITYANVRFGETATPESRFFFKDASGTVYVRDAGGTVVKESDGTPCSAVLTEIWYRHKSSGATVLMIR